MELYYALKDFSLKLSVHLVTTDLVNRVDSSKFISFRVFRWPFSENQNNYMLYAMSLRINIFFLKCERSLFDNSVSILWKYVQLSPTP